MAFKILTGLGIKEDKFQADPRSLSGGWKMRLELARTLINQPDFLILDEPTNHLDLPALEWLEKFLIEFQGTVFFVSHDQDFLNKLSTITLHLAGGTIKEYKGNLDYFLEQRELNQLQSESKAKHIQDRAKQIQKFVDRFRASPAKAGVVGSRLKMLNRLKDLEDTLSYEKPFEEMSIAFPIKKPSGNVVINLEEVSIGYEKPLIKNLNMHIMRGEKVAITGANGLGKSTILKSIAGMLKPLKGKVELGNDVQIGYFAQDHNDGFDDNLTLMEQIRLFATKQEDQHIRKLLGCFLFKKDDAFKKVGILSGGERSRLRLCSLIAADSNFLILDEPTNHLDMTSINLLSHALSEYEGTILFVSHNRSFISQVATQSLKIEDFVF